MELVAEWAFPYASPVHMGEGLDNQTSTTSFDNVRQGFAEMPPAGCLILSSAHYLDLCTRIFTLQREPTSPPQLCDTFSATYIAIKAFKLLMFVLDSTTRRFDIHIVMLH